MGFGTFINGYFIGFLYEKTTETDWKIQEQKYQSE